MNVCNACVPSSLFIAADDGFEFALFLWRYLELVDDVLVREQVFITVRT